MSKTYVLINKTTVRTIKEGLDVNTAIRTLQERGFTVQKIKKPPTMKTLEKWVCDSVVKATDGCSVEPDGECQHGHKSWLLVLGLI